ncbi:ankyrin [Lentithecium fluviatile CBS 122367]|uniref:Ankyrin n=1 Tax=Lentithecium fluviatile CBS 122367 TaxID=1168545 RepID=A0A6G1JJC1_9PLEO|nr:ankyrin [Lentithecium fluviatile CBS 122367]
MSIAENSAEKIAFLIIALGAGLLLWTNTNAKHSIANVPKEVRRTIKLSDMQSSTNLSTIQILVSVPEQSQLSWMMAAIFTAIGAVAMSYAKDLSSRTETHSSRTVGENKGTRDAALLDHDADAPADPKEGPNRDAESQPKEEDTSVEDVELDDLDQLANYIYRADVDCNSPPTDSDMIQPLPKNDIPDMDEYEAASMDDFLRVVHGLVAFGLPFHSFGKDDQLTDEAISDCDSMVQYLRMAMCRFAVRQNRLELLNRCYTNPTGNELWYMVKLAVEYERQEIFKNLVQRYHKSQKEILAKALEYAAYRGNEDMMIVLLASEENVNVNGDKTTHPLTAAVAGHQLGAIRLLILYGAEVNVRNKEWMGRTPYPTLLIAAAGCGNPAVAKELLAAGACPRDHEKEYDTIRLTFASKGSARMLYCLMEAGVQLRGSELEEALSLAVSAGHSKLAEFALKEGANPNAPETLLSLYGSLFQWACAQGHEDIVRSFINYGVDIHRPDRPYALFGGTTPLHAAACCGHFAIADLLKKNGAKGPSIEIVEVCKFAKLGRLSDLKNFIRKHPQVDVWEEVCYGVSALSYARKGMENPGIFGCKRATRKQYEEFVEFLEKQRTSLGKAPSRRAY